MIMLLMTDSFAQSNEKTQSVSLPYLTAEVTIGHTASHRVLADVTFSTNDRAKENVNCLNAYRDIKFVLRDASGAVIKEDPSAWTRELDTMTQQDTYPCEHLSWTTKDSRALLDALFPSVPHGKYTLYMTLAPRGRSDSAVFQPLVIWL